MRRRASCLLLLTAALSGCPDAPPSGPSGRTSPTTTDATTTTTARPDAPTTTTTPTPTPTPTTTPTATGTPTSTTDGPRVAIERPPAPAPGEPITIRHGRLLEVTPELRVGSMGVVGPVAHLEVLVGELCYSAPASVGDLIAVGRGALRVEAIDAVESAVTVRWERPHEPTAPATHEPRPAEGGGLLLRELALFVLDDGARVGVGPVTGDEVMINIFPPGYDEDPGMGYARERARQGAVITSGGKRYTLTRIVPRSPDRSWGTIVLTPG